MPWVIELIHLTELYLAIPSLSRICSRVVCQRHRQALKLTNSLCKSLVLMLLKDSLIMIGNYKWNHYNVFVLNFSIIIYIICTYIKVLGQEQFNGKWTAITISSRYMKFWRRLIFIQCLQRTKYGFFLIQPLRGWKRDRHIYMKNSIPWTCKVEIWYKYISAQLLNY